MGKRVLCFVSIGMLALLIGCGGGGGGQESAAPQSSSQPTPSVSNPTQVSVPDTVPNVFTFIDQAGSSLSSIITSNEIVISGIDIGAPVSIVDGEYSVNGGSFTASTTTISNNQKIKVRVTSSSQFSSAVKAVLTVGGISGTFTVTTLDRDTTPDSFQFQRKTNAVRGALIASNSVTIAGINVPVPVSIQNGEYSIDGGAFTSAAGAIAAGQALVVRVKASSIYSKATQARVTVGQTSADFEVISELPSYVPDKVVYDGHDIVYLLSKGNKLVFRWSVAEERYLSSYVIGLGALVPTTMDFSSEHQRMYLGYSTGAIQYIDVTSDSSVEVPFANTAMGVGGLVAVGKYVLAQDGSGAWATHYVFNRDGGVTDQKDWNYYSREYAWDATSSRVYFFRDDTSPNDLQYEVIDQVTGKISSAGETPYHGSYSIQPPIRVSVNGQYILIGSGDIYNEADLTWSGSLGSQVVDARWMVNGSIVTLTTANTQTTLRRLNGTNLVNLEQLTFSGQALRVVGSDTKMAVLAIKNNNLQIYSYVPNDDSDSDGVPNTQDAFPLDAAASLDTDRDGYPDTWNVGKTQGDSTTGLTLDAYPQDSACYLLSHGDGVHCNYGATVPNYVPDQIASEGDIVYLLSSANRRVYRWSIATGAYLNPYIVGINQGFSTIAPTKISYSSDHKRLYLGYSTGAIQYIDVSSNNASEIPFANTAMGVGGLVAVGKYVLAQDGSGAWATHYVFNRDGGVTDQKDWNYYSREYAWDGISSRVYFFRDNMSPNDLQYEVIDQVTGKISSAGETPYHGSYSIQPPIRVSINGEYVLLGSGDIYKQAGLVWFGSLGSAFSDARWFANGSLVTLTTASNQTTLRRLGATNRANLEQLTFSGQALRIVGSDAKMAVVVINNNTTQFYSYVPNDDSDGDGVVNTQDAFPLDAAASIDTDRDGYPDTWNSGKSQSESTTGLTLDAYPQDSACYLLAHGDGVHCNYGATVPNYTPDQIVNEGDIVYLLSSINKRVYRWSISAGAYINPYVVGINQGVSVVAPTLMSYSSDHKRLYMGYATGAIQYIDVTANTAVEVAFANTAMGVGGLTAVGKYVLAQDASGAWDTHYVFDRDGVVKDQKDWNYYSREYAWDAVNSRVYFFRDGTSPNDLQYEVIDQVTGKISSAGETPYHGSYSVQPPIRVSADGQYVLLGSGDIYNGSGLTWSGSLGSPIIDARWFANGSIVTLTTGNNQTTLRRLGVNNVTTVEQLTYSGQALRVVGSDTNMTVVVLKNGAVQFYNYVPNDDSDGDGVLNTQDAFPLDAAASVDSDRDGYPDAWNSGKSQSDSTTGLILDAYPQDAACYLLAHGDGVHCNYGATIPNYIPDQIVSEGDIVYLLSSANKRVYRWSISTAAYLNPYVVGINQGFSTLAPIKMAYSTDHQRLYLGYSSGAIQYIDVTSSNVAEVAFGNIPVGVNGLAAVGKYLLATPYVFDRNGAITDSQGGTYYSSYFSHEYAWDAVNSRVYYFRDGLSPNDLLYQVIDQTTGKVTSSSETPYHGSYTIQPPLRVSVNGQYILLGSGDIYNQSGLTWSGSLGTQVVDARWFANGSLVTLTTASNQTTLRRLGATNRANLEQLTYSGQALRIVGSDAKMAVVVINNNTTQFYSYVPNDDSDGDGVVNTQDAFPLDAAASVDTDRDGYPDAWNSGKSQSDSTTGLTLDAYPQDSACYLLAHGDGVNCNYGATVPNYVPDQVVSEGDTVYLLSSVNKRVYRWSIATGSYLNPYIVGINQGFSTIAPKLMSYSSNHHRLYLGYSTGAIQYIDVTSNSAIEVPFGNTAMSVGGLAAVGEYLLAQDGSGAWATHYIFDRNGVITDQKDWNYYSREYAWDAVTSRVYFFRDNMSPDDLHYEVIDQTTGKITSANETPYHGSYNYQPPIRVSPNGQYILLGTGDIYNQSDLTWSSSIKAIKDANWKGNVLVDVDNSDLVEIRDKSTFAVLSSYQYLGQPVRIVFGQFDVYLVHVVNNQTTFLKLPFGDQDQDGMPKWWEQLYGLSDSNASDALGDLDGDGVSNVAEYQNNSNPSVADSDSDGLNDYQEIFTYGTNPSKLDSDGDGLSDKDEVLTYHSDPNKIDTDGDGYTDLDEVLYGGDPNDVSSLPHPFVNFSESFESNLNALAWKTPERSAASWSIDSTYAYAGSKSIKSAAVNAGQYSSIKFRGLFSSGQLSFFWRADVQTCCDQLFLYVDGVAVLSLYPSTQWTQSTAQITLGPHDVEWRFQKSSYSTQGTTAFWIDNVTFVKQ